VHRLLTLTIALLFAASAWATEITPGQQYNGPQKLTVQEAGVSFTLPAGWTGGLPQGQQFFVIAKEGFEGFIFMTADEVSESEVLKLMGGPIPLDEGVTLTPKAKPKKEGKRISNTYSVTGGQLEAIGLTQLGAHGVSVLAVAVATPQNLATIQKTLTQVMGSLKLEKVKQAPAQAQAPASGSSKYDRFIRGKRLVRLQTMNGYSERITMDLCSNGRFFRHFNASSVSQLGTAGRDQGGDGNWTLNGNTLAYTLDGDNYTMSVEAEAFPDGSAKVMLNGNRWFTEGNARCN